MPINELVDKLNKKTASIAIVGLGYVGLPLLIRYASEGYHVLGLDIDNNKIEKLNAGDSYIKHISAEALNSFKDNFEATTDFSKAKTADAIIICVPTPLSKHREPDMTYVLGTMQTLSPYFRAGQVISLESTTYPGTTDEELKPRIEANGFTVGQDIFLVYSPEREDPANPAFNTASIPKVCGGVTPNCLKAGLALYGNVIDKMVPVSSTQVAEMTKLLENIHRAVNIGLVNEMKMVTDKMGIDIFEVINAAATKPFGFVPYYPGPGLGGHCIPIDPFYLTWKAREYGVHTRFIELAGEVNTNMPNWVIAKLTDALNERGMALKGRKILLLGIAYKKNVDDIRESPALVIMESLMKKGAKIYYSDPYIPVFPRMREYSFDLKSVALTPENLADYDAVMIVTHHDVFDFDLIKKHARLIIDTRGIYSHSKDKHIISA